ncbi:hypothetical protein GARC_0460 [Paraglaciecola arctica BSs20135]|uniref:Uncharacterized protein n=1 Tax=Paraglaciecola arctica BSs20135 TaxID=493475 RepID=K6YH07_9ALTE|nr:hypothetical protein GARC_0460 [Paraglaciecola arctica BSs20135]
MKTGASRFFIGGAKSNSFLSVHIFNTDGFSFALAAYTIYSITINTQYT